MSWDTAESTLELDAIDEVSSMLRTLQTVRSKCEREAHKVFTHSMKLCD
jgi:hypothetical protein